jgi:ribosomal protein L29
MQIAKLNSLSDKALVHRELQLERDLIHTRIRHRTGQLEDVSQLAKLRKGIARARTVQRNREVDQSLSSNALRDKHRSSFKPGAIAVGDVASAGGFLKGIVDKVKKDE